MATVGFGGWTYRAKYILVAVLHACPTCRVRSGIFLLPAKRRVSILSVPAALSSSSSILPLCRRRFPRLARTQAGPYGLPLSSWFYAPSSLSFSPRSPAIACLRSFHATRLNCLVASALFLNLFLCPGKISLLRLGVPVL